MKFAKSLILAAAIAACSVYVADAVDADCPAAFRKAGATAATCGECFDEYYGATTGTTKCTLRTKPCDLETEYRGKTTDTCTKRVASSSACPDNAEKDKFADKCICKTGYSEHGTTTTPITCSLDMTDEICQKKDKNSKKETVSKCVCKDFYGRATDDELCKPVELKDVSESDCTKIAFRVFDKTAKVCKDECQAGYATDADSPHLKCSPKLLKTACTAATRSFFEDTGLCKCKSGYVATDDSQYSANTDCVESSGAMSSMVVSSAVVLASAVASGLYLL